MREGRAVWMVAACGLVAGVASAGIFGEVESNDTLATANDIGTFDAPGGVVLASGNIELGDADWFSFTLSDEATLSVFASFSGTPNADGVMQIVDSGGVVIAFDDDSGVGLMPSLQIAALSAGTYYVGMSGWGDQGIGSVGTTNIFDGVGHSQEFDYLLTIAATVVPAPGSVALLGLGGLAAARRRR